MCGIGGIVSIRKTEIDTISLLKNMSQVLSHRGPDDEGFALFNDEETVIAGGGDTPSCIYEASYPYIPTKSIHQCSQHYKVNFLHRRLSIIDTSPAGHQPMSYDNGKLWLIFNGEIYNYCEIRKFLKLKGYSFITESDTEVLLAAYLYWGKDCVNHFNGMWAFVIYDKKQNILFGSRDRFGVKPFYYILNPAYFAFASEQKALTTFPFQNQSVNSKAAFDYLVIGRTENDVQGLFQGILELMPSENFIFDLHTHQIKKEKYYALPFNEEWEKFDEFKYQNYVRDIRDLLKEAVELRLRADVPIGTCLSGGMDSSSIVSIIEAHNYQKNSRHQQKAFTSCLPGNESIDETKWAQILIENKKFEWFKTFPDSATMMQKIEDLAYYQDIPVLGTSTYSQYEVMKLVKENNVKVTLDGQGADELFSGYAQHFVAYFYEAIKNISLKEINHCIAHDYPGFSDKRNLATVPLMQLCGKMPFLNTGMFRKEFNYLNKDFLSECNHELSNYPALTLGSLNKTLHEQFTGPELKVLLRTGDRNSMRFSVESRVPFSDHLPLIEYIFGISSAYKIREGESKSLLRSAMKGLVPEQIIHRKDKLGFATPQYRWLQESKNHLRQYITPDLDSFIDSKKLLKDWDYLFATLAPHSTNRLFRILKFAIWKKVFKL